MISVVSCVQDVSLLDLCSAYLGGPSLRGADVLIRFKNEATLEQLEDTFLNMGARVPCKFQPSHP